MNTHEDYSRGNEIGRSSNRSFSFVFTGFFALLTVVPYLRGRHPIRPWALAVSAIFLILALVSPAVLDPLNRTWMKLAHLLSKITTPIFAGVLFYVVITPFALVLRLLGKDLLHSKLAPAVKSYWILRDPPGPDAESMINQF